MASIERRAIGTGVRYDVRFRTPAGQMRKKTFASRAEAKRWAAAVETDKVRGDWLDPNRGKRTFDEWADESLSTRSHLKPKTMLSYRLLLRVHARPFFGSHPIATIDHGEVLRFLSALDAAGSGPGTIANVRNVLRGVLDLAVRSGAIKANPAAGMRVPRPRRQEMAFLSADQVRELALAIEDPGPPKSGGGEHRRATFPELGLLVRFAAYTGLRAGEIGRSASATSTCSVAACTSTPRWLT
jgi:integrase